MPIITENGATPTRCFTHDHDHPVLGRWQGHLDHPDLDARCQMMDTPGVLSRPDEERNCMEALTLASMQHLPTAVIFVMDLSGESGEQSSVQKQVRQHFLQFNLRHAGATAQVGGSRHVGRPTDLSSLSLSKSGMLVSECFAAVTYQI